MADEEPGLDGLDEIWVGPVGPIRVVRPGDHRFDAHFEQVRLADAFADSLTTADELLEGLVHVDEEIRWRAVTRLVARAGGDPRTVPALLSALRDDPSWKVRDAVAMELDGYGTPEVIESLQRALTDESGDVRWSAEHTLTQLGVAPRSGGTRS